MFFTFQEFFWMRFMPKGCWKKVCFVYVWKSVSWMLKHLRNANIVLLIRIYWNETIVRQWVLEQIPKKVSYSLLRIVMYFTNKYFTLQRVKLLSTVLHCLARLFSPNTHFWWCTCSMGFGRFVLILLNDLCQFSYGEDKSLTYFRVFFFFSFFLWFDFLILSLERFLFRLL